MHNIKTPYRETVWDHALKWSGSARSRRTLVNIIMRNQIPQNSKNFNQVNNFQLLKKDSAPMEAFYTSFDHDKQTNYSTHSLTLSSCQTFSWSKILSFWRTKELISVIPKSCHWILFWRNWIFKIYSSRIHFNIIRSCTSGCHKLLVVENFSTFILYGFSFLSIRLINFIPV
jgi:hypothetical protein